MKVALDHALALAARGFRCFPLPSGAKAPPPKGWKDLATNDADKLAAIFADRPEANVGVATGAGLLVLDVDPKRGGLQSLGALEMAGVDIGDTFTVDSANGGIHLYFRVEDEVRNSVDSPGPGLDLRGSGGYVVGPGSQVGGRPYRIRASFPLAPAVPQLVAGRHRAPPSADRADAEPPVRIEREVLQDRGRRYLRDHAPLAIEGSGGNTTTFKVACKLKDDGCDPALTLELMQEEWNERCSPPWPIDELKAIVGNAFEYGENRQGSSAPESAFGPVDGAVLGAVDGNRPHVDETGTASEVQKAPRFVVRSFADLKPTLDKTWLIDDVLPEGGLCVMTAKWNEGKTFNAIDMAMAISRGGAWQSRGVRQGAALYVSAEGSLGNRVEAYRRKYLAGGRDPPFMAIESSVNLSHPKADLDPLIEAAQKIEGLRLIVLDTLARMMVGGDENSGQDMGRMVAHASQLQKKTGATVLLIHHLGKDESRGARGHSSLLGAVDTEITISKGVIAIKKQRDGETGGSFGFRLEVVEIGTDPRGKIVTSCVCIPTVVKGANGLGPIDDGSAAAAALVVLDDITADDGPADAGAWCDGDEATWLRSADRLVAAGEARPSASGLE